MDTAWAVLEVPQDNAKIIFLFEHQELSAILHPCIGC